MNNLSQKELAYENIAEDFDSVMNMYDVNTRLHLVYEKLLQSVDLKGKKVLDAGCGTGWFSKFAEDRGAVVFSMDVGEGLLKQVKRKCSSTCVVGSISEMPFPDQNFDFIVSSEVIEHVEDQKSAFSEFARVLKPGGKIAITTPNKLWFPTVWLANKFSLRPYQGLEKWLSWKQFENELQQVGFEIEQRNGCHLLPFQLSFLHSALSKADNYSSTLYPIMINMGVLAAKK